MDKETALELFARLEAEVVEFEDSDADPEQWIDENTPPKRAYPSYAVRLDAGLDINDERSYRLRITLHRWLDGREAAQAIEWAASEARDAQVPSVEIQNSGIELS